MYDLNPPLAASDPKMSKFLDLFLFLYIYDNGKKNQTFSAISLSTRATSIDYGTGYALGNI